MVRLEGFLNTKYFMLITQKNLIFCFCQMYCSGEYPSHQAQVMCLLFLPFYFSTTLRDSVLFSLNLTGFAAALLFWQRSEDPAGVVPDECRHF